ncbi:MAG: bifunctional N-acetylglucosamine-1-phosphate uridyltransferase/glucosamine-1-phosphate acetyltransferase, partial [Acidobacteriales bacterium]|nr:bifunctional N-acetylglucosamine-1-phosphate uridyltransferase/glucosamine-1-phosphate acetyltransferase [Terriglobales bacterium]
MRQNVIVLSGDAPMISVSTIEGMRDFHLQQRAAMTLLSAALENPTGYGRVLRKSPRSPEVRAIIEEKAATAAQKRIREINSGFYVFDVKQLYGNIGKLSTDNPHAEYYLTDMAEVLRKNGKPVVAWPTRTPNEVLGGNTRAELVDIDQQMRLAKCRQLMSNGVT